MNTGFLDNYKEVKYLESSSPMPVDELGERLVIPVAKKESLSDLLDKALAEARPSNDEPAIIGLTGTDEQNHKMIKELKEAGSQVKQIDSWNGVPIIEVKSI